MSLTLYLKMNHKLFDIDMYFNCMICNVFF